MRIGLFVPCYVDQLAPRIGLATVEILEREGVEVEFPPDQACCGQPLSSAGADGEASRLARRFVDVFRHYEHVICPSASCVAMVRTRYASLLGADAARDLGSRTWELCEFLTQIRGVTRIPGRFPHRVGLHPSCHALRELRLGTSTETAVPRPDPARALLASLDDITLCDPRRPDECCGFGGVFAIDEEAVSCRMGRDRLAAHADAGSEIVASTDVSCLLHLDGLIRRDGRALRVMHVAEILAGDAPADR